MPIDPLKCEKEVMKKHRKAKDAARKQQNSGILYRVSNFSPQSVRRDRASESNDGYGTL